jgi:hypothetical protein
MRMGSPLGKLFFKAIVGPHGLAADEGTAEENDLAGELQSDLNDLEKYAGCKKPAVGTQAGFQSQIGRKLSHEQQSFG